MGTLQERCEHIEKAVFTNSLKVNALLLVLRHYIDYVKKFSDQIERRLLKGEAIPSQEKIYSIFEPHTEWINKGKKNKPVELGHLLLITTDQYQFIIDTKIMEGEKDVSQVKPLQERLVSCQPYFDALPSASELRAVSHQTSKLVTRSFDRNDNTMLTRH